MWYAVAVACQSLVPFVTAFPNRRVLAKRSEFIPERNFLFVVLYTPITLTWQLREGFLSSLIDCEQSLIFRLSHKKSRARWRERQSWGERGPSPFFSSPPLFHLTTNLQNFTFSLAALAFEERRMTARGVHVYVARYFGVSCRPTDLRPKPETTHEKSWQPGYHHP